MLLLLQQFFESTLINYPKSDKRFLNALNSQVTNMFRDKQHKLKAFTITLICILFYCSCMNKYNNVTQNV